MRIRMLASALLVSSSLLSPLLAQAASLPAAGMSMQSVERDFGSPRQKLPAVGNPPITRWVYDGFTVYFERTTTIHSVATEASAPARSAPAGSVNLPRSTPEASTAPALDESEDDTPAVEAPPVQAAPVERAAPPATSEPAPAPAKPAEPEYSFDPVTGRIIIKEAP